MRFGFPFLIMTLIILAAQSSAAQRKDEGATAKRIAEIQREIQGLQKEFAQLRAESRKPPAEARRHAEVQREIEAVLVRIADLQAELRKLQPQAKPKSGVNVSCDLELTPVRGRMIPLPITAYQDGATIRILTVKDKKILAEGKTDPFGHVFLAVPPGNFLVEVRLGANAHPYGRPIEVTVEKDKESVVAFLIRGFTLKPNDRPREPQRVELGRKFELALIEANSAEPKKAPDPIVVSAETLAQAVQDDVNSAAKKYHLMELQVNGVVAKHSEYKGKVAMFQFELMVKDRKTDKVVGFTVFCSLKDPLPKGDKKLDEFAVGKKVTVRGRSTAMGNGQVTLTNCIIVRGGDKGEAKKGSTKP